MAKATRPKAKRAAANKPAKRARRKGPTKNEPAKKKKGRRQKGPQLDSYFLREEDSTPVSTDHEPAEPTNAGGEDDISTQPTELPKERPAARKGARVKGKKGDGKRGAGKKKGSGGGTKGAKRPRKKAGQAPAPQPEEPIAMHVDIDDLPRQPTVPSPAHVPPAPTSPEPSTPPPQSQPTSDGGHTTSSTPDTTPVTALADTPFVSFSTALRRMRKDGGELLSGAVSSAMKASPLHASLNGRPQARRRHTAASSVAAEAAKPAPPSERSSPTPRPSPPQQREVKRKPSSATSTAILSQSNREVRRSDGRSCAAAAPSVPPLTPLGDELCDVSPQTPLSDALSDALTERGNIGSPELLIDKLSSGVGVSRAPGPFHVDHPHISLSLSVGLDGQTSLSFSVAGGERDEGRCDNETTARPQQQQEQEETSVLSGFVSPPLKHHDHPDALQDSLLSRLGKMLANLFAPSVAPSVALSDARLGRQEESDAKTCDSCLATAGSSTKLKPSADAPSPRRASTASPTSILEPPLTTATALW